MERQLLAEVTKKGFINFQLIGEDTFGYIYKCVASLIIPVVIPSVVKSNERTVRISKANSDKA